MKAKGITLALILLVLVPALFFLLRKKEPVIQSTIPLLAPSAPGTVPPPTQTPVPSAASDPIEIPSPESMQAEVDQDPHSTPPSLLRFAESLAPQFDAALKDEPAAVHFFSKLKDCVMAPRTQATYAIRALCLKNAKRLTERYPTLRGNLEQLRGQVEERVLELAD